MFQLYTAYATTVEPMLRSTAGDKREAWDKGATETEHCGQTLSQLGWDAGMGWTQSQVLRLDAGTGAGWDVGAGGASERRCPSRHLSASYNDRRWTTHCFTQSIVVLLALHKQLWN